MIAILAGLGAAVMWATATVCSSRSSRMIGAGSVLAWVMLVGLVITLPWALASGVPSGLHGSAVGWLAIAGVGNVLGLLLEYAGLSVGKVGIVAPIASTEGAIAALLAVVAGEQLAPGAGLALAVITAGIFLATFSRDGQEEADGVAMSSDGPGAPRTPRALAAGASAPDASVVAASGALHAGRRNHARAALLSIAAAVSFGVSLYAAGRISGDLPLAWVLLPARLVGVAAVALPLALTRRLRLTRNAIRFVVAAGLAEVVGFVSFVLGARHGIAITAVLASQFAALSAIAAYLLFGERLRRTQIAGVGAIAVGVAVLTALRA